MRLRSTGFFLHPASLSNSPTSGTVSSCGNKDDGRKLLGYEEKIKQGIQLTDDDEKNLTRTRSTQSLVMRSKGEIVCLFCRVVSDEVSLSSLASTRDTSWCFCRELLLDPLSSWRMFARLPFLSAGNGDARGREGRGVGAGRGGASVCGPPKAWGGNRGKWVLHACVVAFGLFL